MILKLLLVGINPYNNLTELKKITLFRVSFQKFKRARVNMNFAASNRNASVLNHKDFQYILKREHKHSNEWR